MGTATIPLHDAAFLIEGLSDPAAYQHPVRDVRVHQTHSSIVFLAGDFAYKIKKPVKYEFLDYSHLDVRLYFCQEEIRLNAVICPDVYLDVVPVTERDGRLTMGGEGEPVEWAVRMRRLREEDMLSNRLSTGSVDDQDIERIAQFVANLHARAFRDPIDEEYGTPDNIEETIAMACELMENMGGDAGHKGVIRRYLTDFIADHRHILWERTRADRIRDCHGDLRVQNICLDRRFGNGVQLFDCIEFSKDLRFIDTAADIAFLAMDLDLAGRTNLRKLLIDTYGAHMEDDDLRTLLPFYQTYRAVVRGNIAMLASKEAEVDIADRTQHLTMAGAAYDLARCYAGRRSQPALIITVGYSGTGKSVLAHELARRLPAIQLSSDEIRPLVPRSGDRYSGEARARVYDALRRQAAKHLADGTHVILDATFLAEDERAKCQHLAETLGVEFWSIICNCPDSVIRNRIEERQYIASRTLSEAGIGVYESQVREFPTIKAAPVASHLPGGTITVDTSQPVDKAAAQVIDKFLAISRQP